MCLEKGFRIVKCPGCPLKFRISVSEKDYGTTKVIRCPKCGAKGRVEIPCPTPETQKTETRPPFSNEPLSWGFPEDLFGDIFKGKKE